MTLRVEAAGQLAGGIGTGISAGLNAYKALTRPSGGGQGYYYDGQYVGE